jgi:O-methyltransferase involved in polyketide biosynthesis
MEIDSTRPNSGRIYDYLLGGNHNFSADRAAGDRLNATFPTLSYWMRLNRWFLQFVSEELVAADYTCYIDLATGLPTQHYLHELVPETTRIVYNDIDPVTFNYGQEIVKNHPNILYVQGDLRNPERILEQADSFFGGERKVGICLIGVAYFIDDEALANTFQKLYDWAAPGSTLAVTCFGVEQMTPEVQKLFGMYQQIGTTLYPRLSDDLLKLAAPWQVNERGLNPIDVYLTDELKYPIEIERREDLGTMYGGFLKRL